jgi:hypothetical protein
MAANASQSLARASMVPRAGPAFSQILWECRAARADSVFEMSLAPTGSQARKCRISSAMKWVVYCQVLVAACASTAREHRVGSSAPGREPLLVEAASDAGSAGPSLQRDTIVNGASFRYRVSFAEQPNLVYHLDCLSGVALCAKIIFQEFWANRGLDADDQAALVQWKAIRTHYAAEIKRSDPSSAEPPLLVPMGTFDLAERQRIAGLTATTIEAYQRSMALLSSEGDARELAAILHRFAPRFSQWWQGDAFAKGAAPLDTFAQLLADPFLDSFLQKAQRFYEAELPPHGIFEFHLVLQPDSARKLSVAYQLENHSAVEVSSKTKPAKLIDILAHELFHYFFNYTASDARSTLVSRFASSTDVQSVAAFGVFDEAVACALGNGLVGEHYRPEDFAAGLPRSGRLTLNPAASPVGVALLPALQGFLDRSVRISSEEFHRTYLAAARTRYSDGAVPPIEHVRSHVFVGEKGFDTAAAALHDASLAGFPGFREFPSLDAAAQSFLISRPLVSAVIFAAPDRQHSDLFEALGADAKHRTAFTQLALRTRGFVYALPRTPKSYAFVFVAKDDPTMNELVKRFTDAKSTRKGVLVELK